MVEERKISLCGIDEAGRGPLAGSLVIVGVILHTPMKGLMDSKKLTQKKREMLYPIILQNTYSYSVSFSAQEIDDKGISDCLHRGLIEIQNNLQASTYLFDGNSSFGVDNITTMVKADTKISEVSAASILAKVTRDREILHLAKDYPEYAFEKHKGYGTKAHIEAIKKYGRCKIHRKTFKVKALGE